MAPQSPTAAFSRATLREGKADALLDTGVAGERNKRGAGIAISQPRSLNEVIFRNARNQNGPMGLLVSEGSYMPTWLEILLDVMAFAGFIVIAIFYRPRRKNGEPTP